MINRIQKNTSETPLVSIIIVNWNGKEFLNDCILSLKKQSFKNFEVILVDNGSHDGSIELINKNYQDFVHVIELPNNRGFGGGNNAGIAKTKGVYVALLNNDTAVDCDWLANLVHCIQSDDSIGMVGSKILNYYKRNEIDNTGHLIYPDGLNRGRGRLEIDCGQYDSKTDILFPSGCASLYKKKMLEEVGGFDEDFFTYGDDTDIGLHARYLGYKAVYCPQAVVYHKYSGTGGMYSVGKAYYVERNRIWILVKYFPLEYIVLSPYFTLKRLFFQAYGVVTHQGAAGKFVENESYHLLLKTFFSAYWSAFKAIPNILKKRKNIHKNKKLSIKDFKYLLNLHTISCREISLKD